MNQNIVPIKRRKGSKNNFIATEKFVRVCRDKTSYYTSAQANRSAKEFHARYHRDYHAYECPICGKYHLTTH